MGKGTIGPKRTKKTEEVGKGTSPELLRRAGCLCPALAQCGTPLGAEAGWTEPGSEAPWGLGAFCAGLTPSSASTDHIQAAWRGFSQEQAGSSAGLRQPSSEAERYSLGRMALQGLSFKSPSRTKIILNI